MGILALDIDGTLTDKTHQISYDVVKFLADTEYDIILVTGRSLSYAKKAIHVLTFPFTIICQHGADVLEMPGETSLEQHYLSKEIVQEIDEKTGCVVYSGYATGDFCYYRPEKHTQEMLDYFKRLEALASAPWIPIKSWDDVAQDSFPLIKIIGKEDELRKLAPTFNNVHTEIILDPIDTNNHLIMLTHPDVSKGKTLKRIIKNKHLTGQIIAAGDDENDISLLQAADVKIAMSHAPKSLKDVADIIAKDGIVEALSRKMR